MGQSQQQSSATNQQQAASGAGNLNINNDVQNKVQTAIQQDTSISQNANVSVNVQNNQLVLTGTVPNEEAKRRAEQIAQSQASSSGLAVVNQLTVANATTSTAGANTVPCPQGTSAATTTTQGVSASGMPQSDIKQANSPATTDQNAKNKNHKHKKNHGDKDKDNDHGRDNQSKDNSNPR